MNKKNCLLYFKYCDEHRAQHICLVSEHMPNDDPCVDCEYASKREVKNEHNIQTSKS